MFTPHLTQRVQALCASIAEEKDPAKFLLLVRELNDVFENGGAEFEHAQSTTAWRTTNVRDINCWICNEVVSINGCKFDEHGRPVHEQCCVTRLAPQNVTRREPSSRPSRTPSSTEN